MKTLHLNLNETKQQRVLDAKFSYITKFANPIQSRIVLDYMSKIQEVLQPKTIGFIDKIQLYNKMAIFD